MKYISEYSNYNNFEKSNSIDEDIEDIVDSLAESLGCKYYIFKIDDSAFDIYLSKILRGEKGHRPNSEAVSSKKLRMSLVGFNERIKKLPKVFNISLKTIESFVENGIHIKDPLIISTELDKYPWSPTDTNVNSILIKLTSS